jgi:hypothetical protein
MKTPLEHARSQVGVVEEPGNRGVPLERYGLPGEDALPWCARFLRWCFASAGTPLPGQRYLIGKVSVLKEALEQRGAILPIGTTPQPGDLVFFRDRGKSDAGAGHHVALLEVFGPRRITTIDGNWDDKVGPVDRSRVDPSIWCYARWPARPLA